MRVGGDEEMSFSSINQIASFLVFLAYKGLAILAPSGMMVRIEIVCEPTPEINCGHHKKIPHQKSGW